MGGPSLTCGSAFFSSYQFEILSHFSLCQKLLKKRKKKRNLKNGMRRFGADLTSENGINSQFFYLWSDFSK